jgi:hypothetical protein
MKRLIFLLLFGLFMFTPGEATVDDPDVEQECLIDQDVTIDNDVTEEIVLTFQFEGPPLTVECIEHSNFESIEHSNFECIKYSECIKQTERTIVNKLNLADTYDLNSDNLQPIKFRTVQYLKIAGTDRIQSNWHSINFKPDSQYLKLAGTDRMQNS